MKKQHDVTPEMLEALRKINIFCGRKHAVTPVSHTLTRQLAKAGLVFMRVTKVYGRANDNGGDEKRNIVHACVSGDGANLLQATTGMKVKPTA